MYLNYRTFKSDTVFFQCKHDICSKENQKSRQEDYNHHHDKRIYEFP